MIPKLTCTLLSILDYWNRVCSPTADVSWALFGLSARISAHAAHEQVAAFILILHTD